MVLNSNFTYLNTNVLGNNTNIPDFLNNNSKVYLSLGNGITGLTQKKIFNNMKKLRGIILDDLKNNKKIIGYGAPTKAALLLKLAKLEYESINYTIEDNSLKINKYIPKTDVQIKPFKNIHSSNPNVMIVFAWNFASDIIKKLKKNKIKELKIIVPLPKVKIISL